jgi:hypothetical protein
MSSGGRPARASGCDLFVSYATSDAREIAENVVVDLERRGLRCWIAPRDIPAGTRSWAAEIVRSIRDSDNFLLLLSEAANASEEIEKELSEAARHRKTVFVIRVSDIEPSDGLGYHLNRVQWRDLFRNREDVLNEIAGRVLALREAKGQAAKLPPEPALSSSPGEAVALNAAYPAKTGRPLWPLIVAGIGAVAVLGTGAALLLRPVVEEPSRTVTVVGVNTGVNIPAAPQTSPVSPAASQPVASAPAVGSPPAAQVPTPAINPPVASVPALPAAVSFPVEAPPGVDPALFGKVHAAILQMAPRSRIATREAEIYIKSPTAKALVGAPPFASFRRSGYPEAGLALAAALEGCSIAENSVCRPIMVNDEAVAPDGYGEARATSLRRILHAGKYDPELIPVIEPGTRSRLEVVGYATGTLPRAAAIHPVMGLYMARSEPTQHEAEKKALADCEAASKTQAYLFTCYLYASADQVVLPQRLTQPLSAAAPPATPPAAPAPAAASSDDLRTKIIAAIRSQAPDYLFAERQTDRYITARNNRALAVARPTLTWRSLGAPTPEEAVASALEGCAITSRRECDLLASNDDLKTLADFPGVRELSARRVAYEGVFDPAMIPVIFSTGRRLPALADYSGAPGFKAMALSPAGIWHTRTGAASAREAETAALRDCVERVRRSIPEPIPCYLYATGDRVILRQRRQEPLP